MEVEKNYFKDHEGWNPEGSLLRDQHNAAILKQLLESAQSSNLLRSIFERNQLNALEQKQYMVDYYRGRLEQAKSSLRKQSLPEERKEQMKLDKNKKNRQERVSL